MKKVLQDSGFRRISTSIHGISDYIQIICSNSPILWESALSAASCGLQQERCCSQGGSDGLVKHTAQKQHVCHTSHMLYTCLSCTKSTKLLCADQEAVRTASCSIPERQGIVIDWVTLAHDHFCHVCKTIQS